jgi:hypothetical protein
VVEERQVREMLDRLASLHRRAATTREVRDLEPVGNGGARHGLAMMASIISPVGRSTSSVGWAVDGREGVAGPSVTRTEIASCFQTDHWRSVFPEA